MKIFTFILIALLAIAMVGTIGITKPVKAASDQPITQAQTFSNSSLGDLIVLNGLFGPGHGFYNGYNAHNLAGLIALDRINGSDGGTYSLGDLIVLNSLFGPGYGFYNPHDLAGLIAVDRLTR